LQVGVSGEYASSTQALKLSLADASSLICCWAEDSTIRRTKRDNLTLMLNRPIISKDNEYEARTWLRIR